MFITTISIGRSGFQFWGLHVGACWVILGSCCWILNQDWVMVRHDGVSSGHLNHLWGSCGLLEGSLEQIWFHKGSWNIHWAPSELTIRKSSRVYAGTAECAGAVGRKNCASIGFQLLNTLCPHSKAAYARVRARVVYMAFLPSIHPSNDVIILVQFNISFSFFIKS